MKNFKVIFISLIVLLSFVGCSGKNDIEEVEQTITNLIAEYQNKEFENMNNYFENQECPILELYVADNQENNLIMDTITKNLTYNIDNIEINKNKATVTITSENVDMSEIMPVVLNDFLELGAEKSKEPDFDEDTFLYEILESKLLDENIETKKITFTESLVKKKGKWVIAESGTTQFYDGITGRYFSYTLIISESLKMITGEME